MVWNLYGKKYELTDYIPFHPGGETILKNMENEPDSTALFETYHAFSRKEYYKTVLKKYEILDENTGKENLYPDFDFTNYNKLLERIKTRFPNRNSIKATYEWYFQNSFVLILYFYTFYRAFLSDNKNTIYKCVFSQIAGLCYISLGFNIFHDASHYAVSLSPKINNFLAKTWASWGLWNGDIWFYHHIVNHHSYTGLEKKDPDLYHLRPFVNKTVGKAQLLNHKTDFLPFITIFFPGYYVGQMIAYFASPFQSKTFHVKIPRKNYYDIIDLLLITIKVYCLYCGGIFATIHYFLALNFWYHINIAIDHDTYETIIENHYSGKDWLKIQICNSANFMNQSWLWTRIFGGINYQIEHHLFPNMSNVHYPIIAPIVQEFCKENGITYVHHENLWGAYQSYLKMLRVRNSV